MRAAAALVGVIGAMGTWLPACAFPTVSYDESLCEGLPRCAAGECGDGARQERDACAASCIGGNPPCLSGCNAALDEALAACTDACRTCADESGCASFAGQCEALVGAG